MTVKKGLHQPAGRTASDGHRDILFVRPGKKFSDAREWLLALHFLVEEFLASALQPVSGLVGERAEGGEVILIRVGTMTDVLTMLVEIKGVLVRLK
nr:hypothetical protein [Agreia pratensis]